MKFSFGYPFFEAPTNPEFLSGQAFGQIAIEAEKAGFGSVFLSEHPAPTKNWRDSGGHDALDPFVALAAAGAVTKDLALLVNLTVVPYRNPFMLAKAAATADVLSGGRLILGLGTGYLKGEYFALGVDFEERNQLFDESVEVLKLAFSGEPVNYDGIHFSAKDIVSQPVPIQKPHPPFWLGGNSKLTRRRVAEWGQGWMPMPNPKALADRRRSAHLETVEDLKQMIGYMKDHAQKMNRTQPIDIIYMTFEGGMPGTRNFNLSQHLEAISELAELGVSWLAVNSSGSSLSAVLEQISYCGQEILPACKNL